MQVAAAVAATLGPSVVQQRLSVVELAAQGCAPGNLAAGVVAIVQGALRRRGPQADLTMVPWSLSSLLISKLPRCPGMHHWQPPACHRAGRPAQARPQAAQAAKLETLSSCHG